MYKNYGDVNFFDYGVLVEKESENIYNIITCQTDCDSENNYLFSTCQVDITDSWIDKHDVCAYASIKDVSINDIEEEKVWFAIAVVNYYGAYHCNGDETWKKKNEVIDYINSYINIDDADFYSNNFDNDNRNLEIEIYYHTGNHQNYVYDSQNVNLLKELYWLETGDSIEIISK